MPRLRIPTKLSRGEEQKRGSRGLERSAIDLSGFTSSDGVREYNVTT
jgi:hypothetical protein